MCQNYVLLDLHLRDDVYVIICILYTDTVSYRNEKNGSHFIQDIVEIFNQHAHQDDVEELFRKAKPRCLARQTSICRHQPWYVFFIFDWIFDVNVHFSLLFSIVISSIAYQ